MARVWLWVSSLTLIGSGAAQAASYQDRAGIVHDPIQQIGGGDSPYSGNNLEPSANLSNAILTLAKPTDTWLYSADLDDVRYRADATWTGAKYSRNAKDNNGHPIADTIFPTGMDQAWRDEAGMVAVPEQTKALLVGGGPVGVSTRRRSAATSFLSAGRSEMELKCVPA